MIKLISLLPTLPFLENDGRYGYFSALSRLWEYFLSGSIPEGDCLLLMNERTPCVQNGSLLHGGHHPSPCRESWMFRIMKLKVSYFFLYLRSSSSLLRALCLPLGVKASTKPQNSSSIFYIMLDDFQIFFHVIVIICSRYYCYTMQLTRGRIFL